MVERHHEQHQNDRSSLKNAAQARIKKESGAREHLQVSPETREKDIPADSYATESNLEVYYYDFRSKWHNLIIR